MTTTAAAELNSLIPKAYRAFAQVMMHVEVDMMMIMMMMMMHVEVDMMMMMMMMAIAK